ncbi:FG-GAP repeat protein [Rubripirellula lacrimiformis]|uniref:FG-GAP repeat protein n=2 Tax=Rubripirellula lacrimiformis TaxID=1930273 RepID=A0A517NG92_9BACT|nr:FG-GAP repeat protein [Rubripirellula lacrimiformis]
MDGDPVIGDPVIDAPTIDAPTIDVPIPGCPTTVSPSIAVAAGRIVAAACCLLMVCGLVVGCGGSPDPSGSVPQVPERPLRKMVSLTKRGLTQQAWEWAPQVLEIHGDDPDVIASVAQLAYKLEKTNETADLLARACQVESYVRPDRIEQATVALIGVGRLYEAMDLLEIAIEQHPEQVKTRRLLFDLVMGTEDRVRGAEHGRVLVRARQFDMELLTTLSNTERRSMDPDVLTKMTDRNEGDRRPLLGTAKVKFDEGDYATSRDLLRQIIETHPDYLPAQVLLGRCLAASDLPDELKRWAEQVPSGSEAYPGYWIAIGDWARSRGQWEEAARCYWEATGLDPDVLEAWSKLGTMLAELRTSDGAPITKLDPDLIDQVQARSTRLSKFNQLKNRFERTGKISREIVLDIVNVLLELGRPWEAEAWASVAMSLPENDAVPLESTRTKIIQQLDRQTPWQTVDANPELQLDLTRFSLPSIAKSGGGMNKSRLAQTPPKADSGQPGSRSLDPSPTEPEPGTDPMLQAWRLENLADAAGVQFFGRTSDQLDQPGIMLYQTLGCGGGTIDFDLDGWPDLYLMAAGGKPPSFDSAANELLRNLDGQFASVTSASATGDRGFGQGVAVGDINEDGFPDLLLLNYGPNTLLINNGDGTFADQSQAWGIRLDADAMITWSTSAAIADVDGDGLSDAVVVNYCAGLEPTTDGCPLAGTDSVRSCTPVKFAAHRDWILQGKPQGTLVDRTDDWSMHPAVPGRGLGIVAGSLASGSPASGSPASGSPASGTGVSVFVANDMTNNHFWTWDQRGGDGGQPAMMESAMIRGVGTDGRSLALGSMGIATSDLDSDGDMDLYVTNFDKEYNTFHDQRSPGMWQDQTSPLGLVGVTMPVVGFGTEAVDLDLDGTPELVVTNGHVDVFSRGDERVQYEQPMQIFRRGSDNAYVSIADSIAGDYLQGQHVGRALWTIDADRDGRMDLVVTHQTEPVALLKNQCPSQRECLKIQLVGRGCQRDAIGATVTVSFIDQNAAASMVATQTSGDGYLCSNQRGLRFAVPAGLECSIDVQWPDGTKQTHSAISPNADLVVIQGDAHTFAVQ